MGRRRGGASVASVCEDRAGGELAGHLTDSALHDVVHSHQSLLVGDESSLAGTGALHKKGVSDSRPLQLRSTASDGLTTKSKRDSESAELISGTFFQS